MEPPTKFAASPGTPLFPISPERVGKISNLSQSPSMPEFGKPSLVLKPSLLSGSPEQHFRHSRNNSASDAHVQGLVARFDGLSVKDYKAQSEVAIRRADMAREMAEMERDKSRREAKSLDEELRRMREEIRKQKKDIEEGKERERKVSKRLEVVMEEYHRTKETQSHATGIYEKEIRKSRKEAFKTGSSLVKLQEELKATRNSLRITQSGLENEKLKSARREQEAFTSQYQLIGVQEELQKAQERIKVIEEERDALKTSLQEEEVARIAAEGRIALPSMNDEEDEDLIGQSPRKSPRKPRLASEERDSEVENKENRVPKKTLELQGLHEELTMERRMREKAQEQIEFMKMECQFQICSCRVAEQAGHGYVHDLSYVSEMEKIRPAVVVREVTPPASVAEDEDIDVEMTNVDAHSTVLDQAAEVVDEIAEEIAETTFHTVLAEPSQIFSPVPEPEKEATAQVEVIDFEPEVEHLQEDAPDTNDFAIEDEPIEDEEQIEEPQTPVREIRTVTTTTTIPMLFSPYPAHGVPTTPSTLPANRPQPFASPAIKADGTLDREAALAQIRARRGRARSVAMGHATPRKQMVEGVQGRRDIKSWNGRDRSQ